MRRFVTATLAMALLALAPISTANAAGETLTVTPSTDLVQGQLVEIVGAADGSGISGLGFCASDADLSSLTSAQQDCELLDFDFGAFGVEHTWTAERFVTTSDGEEDCLIIGCLIGFAGAPSLGAASDFVITVPLDYRSAPTVSVVPDSRVLDGADVEVSISDFPAGATGAVVQCVVEDAPQPDGAPGGCETLAPFDGDPLSVTVSAPRWISDSNGELQSCSATRCVIGIAVGDAPDIEYYLRNIFYSPTAVITSNTPPPWSYGQVVTVRGANLDRTIDHWTALICGLSFDLTIAVDQCGATDATPGEPFSSTYESDVTLERHIIVDGESYDCGRAPIGRACAVVLVGYDGPGPDATIVRAETSYFDFLLPAIPALVLDNGGEPLVASQTVDVTIEPASTDPGHLATCPLAERVSTIDDAERLCDAGVVVPAHDTNWTTELELDRRFASDGRVVDCLAELCELVYLSGPDPATPAPERHGLIVRFRRNVSITPSSGTVAVGDLVEFSASGLPTDDGAEAVVLQCGFQGTISFGTFHCRRGDAEPDFDGDFEGSIEVSRYIPTPSGDPIDCVGGALPCGFLLGVVGGGANAFASPGALLQVTEN